MPAEVRLELAAAALLLPIMHADLAWDVSTELGATDATPKMRGTTRAKIPYELAHELYRGAAHNGEYTRMDWDDKALGLHPTRLHHCAEHILQLLPCLKWVDGGGSNFARAEHVNPQEMQALLHELRHAAMHGAGHGIRKVVLIDSRVVVGALGQRAVFGSPVEQSATVCYGVADLRAGQVGSRLGSDGSEPK
jgi:hypothetical protein